MPTSFNFPPHHHPGSLTSVKDSLLPLQEAMASPLPPELLRDDLPIGHPQSPRQEARSSWIHELFALDNLPVFRIRDIVGLVGRRLPVQSLLLLRELRVDKELAGAETNILTRVFLVAVVQAGSGQPGATEQAKTGAGLGELTGQETAELGADELGVHVAGQEVGAGKAVPVLAKADGVTHATDLEERLVDGERCGVSCVDTVGACQANVNGEEQTQGYHGQLQLGGNLADETLGIGVSKCSKQSVNSKGSVEGKEGIGRVHEPLFLVRLQRENGKPHVERSQEDHGAEAGLESLGRLGQELLQHQDGKGEECQDKPDVEVQGKVLEVEIPGLSAIKLGAAGLGEDVVLDNVPRGNLDLPVEEGVDQHISELENFSTRYSKRGQWTKERCDLPQEVQPQRHHGSRGGQLQRSDPDHRKWQRRLPPT